MARKEYSGGGKLWLNGTLIADVTQMDLTIGGQTSRVVTTGGNTGEVSSDPTMAKLSGSGAVAKRASDYDRVRRLHKSKADATFRVQIGADTETVIGKVSSVKLSGAVGKGEFSFEIEGDAQE